MEKVDIIKRVVGDLGHYTTEYISKDRSLFQACNAISCIKKQLDDKKAEIMVFRHYYLQYKIDGKIFEVTIKNVK